MHILWHKSLVLLTLAAFTVACGTDEKKDSDGNNAQAPPESPSAEEAIEPTPQKPTSVTPPTQEGDAASSTLLSDLAETIKELKETSERAHAAERRALEAEKATLKAEKQIFEAQKSATDSARSTITAEESLKQCRSSLPTGDSHAAEFGPALRRICEALQDDSQKPERHTEGWESWKDKLQLTVKDLHSYSPRIGKWSLLKIDSDSGSINVKHNGSFFGYGLTAELSNGSDKVLTDDSIVVWASYNSPLGQRVCFGHSTASRSWNPHAKKGTGAWIKEGNSAEKPFRPGERKRYSIKRTDCFDELFIEYGVTDITIDVYAQFRTLPGKWITAGPLAHFEQSGGLLRGLPTGNPDEVWQHRIGKKIEPVRLLYAAGDHVLVARDRSLSWVPALSVGGHTPATPPAVSALPETTGGVERTYGNLTINLDNWKITNWTDAAGKVSHGHRLLSVDATIGIDTSTITMTLLQAVEQARQNLTIAEATLVEKQALFDAASASPDAAAKKQAQSNLKAAQKGIKDGQKALSSTEKSLTGGVQKFLLEQTKAIDCGSFTLDTGRKTLKPKKGSLTRKSCNPLKAGQPVSAQLHFELERWDVPFVISWKGPGNSLQFARVASKKLASIPSR